MLKLKASVLLVAGAMMVLPGAAMAQLGKQHGKPAGVTSTAGQAGAVTEQSLVQRYETLAGSADNAKSLVNGLRQKTEVVLVGPMLEPPPAPPPTCTPGTRFCKEAPASPTPTITDETIKFVPATEAMGWGNVDIALALAEAHLKAKSVHTVKPRHLKAALEGGTAGNVTFEGILAMRAAGAGWGDIAKSLGFELK